MVFHKGLVLVELYPHVEIQVTKGRNHMRSTHVDAGLRNYLHQISQFPLLTPQNEIALAKKIQGGDTNARNEMIQSYLRLVVTIAQDYLNLGLPLADLISEGTIGLTKAVERFDPAKGAKLSTYAALWIKQSITTASRPMMNWQRSWGCRSAGSQS